MCLIRLLGHNLFSVLLQREMRKMLGMLIFFCGAEKPQKVISLFYVYEYNICYVTLFI